MKKLAVLLPILNETENILELLVRLKKSLAGYEAKIVLVDDGSTDGTLGKVRSAQQENLQIILLERIKTQAGCMRGDALLFGLRYIEKIFSPDYIVELDGDLSHQPEEIKTGVDLIEKGYDIALGSKYLNNSHIEGRSFSRNFISYANSLLLRIFLGFDISDYSNGFRVYNRNAAQVLLHAKIKYGSPIYLAEVIALWKIKKLKFAEFAITYNGRTKGKSKVIFTDILAGIKGAFDITWNYYFGKDS